MNLLNPNYKKLYALYKKLPCIASITMSFLIFAWSIIDVSVFSNSRYHDYGIMELDAAILPLLIWWGIGVVMFFATWFFTSLIISATVTRTDAIIEIQEHLKNN